MRYISASILLYIKLSAQTTIACTLSPTKMSKAIEISWSVHGLTLHYFQALEKYTVEKDIAGYIKKEFDKKHGPMWHCIVGRHFGKNPPASEAISNQSTALCQMLDMGFKYKQQICSPPGKYLLNRLLRCHIALKRFLKSLHWCRFICHTWDQAFHLLLPR